MCIRDRSTTAPIRTRRETGEGKARRRTVGRGHSRSASPHRIIRFSPSMSYQVLARKYRPQKFSEVIGQEHVTRTLKNAIAQGRIAHGYISVSYTHLRAHETVLDL